MQILFEPLLALICGQTLDRSAFASKYVTTAPRLRQGCQRRRFVFVQRGVNEQRQRCPAPDTSPHPKPSPSHQCQRVSATSAPAVEVQMCSVIKRVCTCRPWQSNSHRKRQAKGPSRADLVVISGNSSPPSRWLTDCCPLAYMPANP